MSIQRNNIAWMLSYLGSLLLFLGVCRLYFFYYAFNIPIIHFLEFSEILTSFLNFIVIAIISVVVLFTLGISFYYKDKEANIKRKWINPYLVFLICIIIIIGLFIYIPSLGLSDERRISVVVILGCFFFLVWAALWVFSIYKNKWLSEFQKYKNLILALFVFLISIITVFAVTRIQVYNIKYNNAFAMATIYFKNGTVIRSSSKGYFIGKTNKYLFYYNSKNDLTTVYQEENIEKIEFTSALNILVSF